MSDTIDDLEFEQLSNMSVAVPTSSTQPIEITGEYEMLDPFNARLNAIADATSPEFVRRLVSLIGEIDVPKRKAILGMAVAAYGEDVTAFKFVKKEFRVLTNETEKTTPLSAAEIVPFRTILATYSKSEFTINGAFEQDLYTIPQELESGWQFGGIPRVAQRNRGFLVETPGQLAQALFKDMNRTTTLPANGKIVTLPMFVNAASFTQFKGLAHKVSVEQAATLDGNRVKMTETIFGQCLGALTFVRDGRFFPIFTATMKFHDIPNPAIALVEMAKISSTMLAQCRTIRGQNNASIESSRYYMYPYLSRTVNEALLINGVSGPETPKTFDKPEGPMAKCLGHSEDATDYWVTTPTQWKNLRTDYPQGKRVFLLMEQVADADFGKVFQEQILTGRMLIVGGTELHNGSAYYEWKQTPVKDTKAVFKFLKWRVAGVAMNYLRTHLWMCGSITAVDKAVKILANLYEGFRPATSSFKITKLVAFDVNAMALALDNAMETEEETKKRALASAAKELPRKK